ncbi:melanization protease 1-like [Thrips palmi]|uniref:CLIP domain-containing serine protease n=1 Tax=Thrips palmi TaxID=161013 RepID=A0A6P8ZZU3_THRPL|nr:melanization protease 1-like [Thrips palmi]
MAPAPPALLLWLAGAALWAALCLPAALATAAHSQRTCEAFEKCVPLSDCKSLLRLVTHKDRKPSEHEKALLRGAQCGWSPTSAFMPLVCCDLVPWGRCGEVPGALRDAANGPANEGEFPWMARLLYRGPADRADGADGAELLHYEGCAASLISDRYLLTAASCVTARDNPPAYVRLGELDAPEDPACVANSSDCSSTAFNVAVQDVVVHPEYAVGAAGHQHDIALVRLKTAVRYSEHVAPVCLPITDPLGDTLKKDRPLTVLGWGSLHRANTNTTRRLTKSVLREVPHEFCTEKYRETPDHVDGVHQLCGRGLAEGSDACHGDRGAPLSSTSVRQGAVLTILEGVASFGTVSCATDGMPAVFARVATYLPWIMTSIKVA